MTELIPPQIGLGGTPILERVDLLTAGISRVLCPNRVSGVEAVGTVPGEDPGYGNVPGGGPVTVGRTVPGEVVGDSPSIGPGEDLLSLTSPEGKGAISR